MLSPARGWELLGIVLSRNMLVHSFVLGNTFAEYSSSS